MFRHHSVHGSPPTLRLIKQRIWTKSIRKSHQWEPSAITRRGLPLCHPGGQPSMSVRKHPNNGRGWGRLQKFLKYWCCWTAVHLYSDTPARENHLLPPWDKTQRGHVTSIWLYVWMNEWHHPPRDDTSSDWHRASEGLPSYEQELITRVGLKVRYYAAYTSPMFTNNHMSLS